MAQEYTINSEELETKIRQLLPSQGGRGAGVDLSASTQIVPIVDLTESAEGSNLRSDLQRSLSFSSMTSHNVSNTTTDIITNTGYFRVFGIASFLGSATSTNTAAFQLTDGASTKVIQQYTFTQNTDGKENYLVPYDFEVFLAAGDICQATTSTNNIFLIGSSRQIASIDGTLVNP